MADQQSVAGGTTGHVPAPLRGPCWGQMEPKVIYVKDLGRDVCGVDAYNPHRKRGRRVRPAQAGCLPHRGTPLLRLDSSTISEVRDGEAPDRGPIGPMTAPEIRQRQLGGGITTPTATRRAPSSRTAKSTIPSGATSTVPRISPSRKRGAKRGGAEARRDEAAGRGRGRCAARAVAGLAIARPM